MIKDHHYQVNLRWTGNTGPGTKNYHSYKRDHDISGQGKVSIPCSSDPAFQGDITRYNPEELLVASLSSCHMLWYLHLCANANIVVTEYQDHAEGFMKEENDGSGYFTEVILHPKVFIQEPSMIKEAKLLHDKAHELCFIANSINFRLRHIPDIQIDKGND